MVIHAYSEEYLYSAQRIMGDMFDYASDSYEMDLDVFFSMFLVSDVAYQFQTENPSYVAGKTFQRIYKAVPIREILRMYPAFHEMDIMQFADAMNERLAKFYTETNLQRYRLYAGLSQSELAQISNIPVRQIRLFEERRQNINHARAITVMKLV